MKTVQMFNGVSLIFYRSVTRRSSESRYNISSTEPRQISSVRQNDPSMDSLKHSKTV